VNTRRDLAFSTSVTLQGPFDLPLSLEAAARFLPPRGLVPTVLRVAARLGRRPTIFEIRQTRRSPPRIEAFSTSRVHRRRLQERARWLVSADLDLRPFYRLVATHPIMGPVSRSLNGLKPLRPPSLFEMVVIAITEQQLSLAAAFHIRERLIARFGTPFETLWIFPSPEALAEAPLGDLMSCGLSRRKAEYVKEFAQRVAEDTFDLDALTQKSDADAGACLMSQRGLGTWSAQYILVRGLGRPDCLPAADVGLRRAAGEYLAHGRQLSREQLEQALSPFTPFRGLAAFYLSVAARLNGVISLDSSVGRHEA
jgi:DNA-3-methyladenine glycosylase II